MHTVDRRRPAPDAGFPLWRRCTPPDPLRPAVSARRPDPDGPAVERGRRLQGLAPRAPPLAGRLVSVEHVPGHQVGAAPGVTGPTRARTPWRSLPAAESESATTINSGRLGWSRTRLPRGARGGRSWAASAPSGTPTQLIPSDRHNASSSASSRQNAIRSAIVAGGRASAMILSLFAAAHPAMSRAARAPGGGAGRISTSTGATPRLTSRCASAWPA